MGTMLGLATGPDPARWTCEPAPRSQRGARSGLESGSTDAADLEVPALPAGDGDEEDGELLELPHPFPPRGVVAVRAGPRLAGAEVLLPGPVAEEEEHAG